MATSPTNNLLNAILQDLDQLIESAKIKQQDKTNDAKSNLPKSDIGSVKTEKSIDKKSGQIDQQQIASLSSSIVALSKISKKDVDTAIENLNTFVTAIKNVKMDEKDVKGFNSMLSSIGSLNNVLAGMTGDLFKTLGKYNPAKGYIMGKNMKLFYAAMLKGFVSGLVDVVGGMTQKNLGENLEGFSKFLSTLMSIKFMQLMKLSWGFKMLDPNTGRRLKAFLSPIIDAINMMPYGEKNKSMTWGDNGKLRSSSTTVIANPKVSGFIDVITALSKITMGDLIVWSAMGRFLDEDKGKKIGGFFGGFVERMSKEGPAKTQAAANMVKSITMMFTMLSVSLIAIAGSVFLFGPKNVGIALGVLTAISLGGIGLMHLLGGVKSAVDDKKAIYMASAISMLIGSLSLSLAALALIVKEYDNTEIAGGLGLLTAISLGAVGIMHLMSTIPESKQAASLKSVLAVSTLMLSMSLIAKICVSVGNDAIRAAAGIASVVALAYASALIFKRFADIKAKEAGQGVLSGLTVCAILAAFSLVMIESFAPMVKKLDDAGWKNVVNGMGVTAAMILGMLGIVKLASIPDATDMIKGGAVILATMGLIYVLSLVMNKFAEFVVVLKDVSIGQTWNAFGLTYAMIAGITATCALLGLLVTGPQAVVLASGAIVLLAIEGLIYGLSCAMLKFSEFIKDTSSMTPDMIKSAMTNITGENGLVSAIINIVNALSKIGVKTTAKMAGITAVLNPLFSGLGQFVDIVKSMAVLQYVDHFDENGLPVYQKLPDNAFSVAADNLSTGFTKFLTNIYEGFNGKNMDDMKKIIKQLTKGDIMGLMNSLSGFAAAINMYASSEIPDQWDANGNPSHYMHLGDTEFTAAAESISGSFVKFLTVLNEKLTNAKEISKKVKALMSDDEGFTKIIDVINQLSQPIILYASGETEINGKKYKTDVTTLNLGVENLVTPIATLFARLSEVTIPTNINNIGYYIDKILEPSKKLVEFEVDKAYKDRMNSLTEGNEVLFTWLNKTTMDLKVVNNYTNCVAKLSEGLRKESAGLSGSTKNLKSAADAIKELDKAIQDGEEKRNKSFIELSNNFKSVSGDIKELNAQLNESINGMQKLNNMNTARTASAMQGMVQKAAELVQHSVTNQNSINNQTTNNTYNQSSNSQQTSNTVQNNGVASAEGVQPNMTDFQIQLIAVLDAWLKDKKDLTLELTDRGAVALGSIYSR